MAHHVFVAMPYGRKPALSEAGFEVFRADEGRRAR